MKICSISVFIYLPMCMYRYLLMRVRVLVSTYPCECISIYLPVCVYWYVCILYHHQTSSVQSNPEVYNQPHSAVHTVYNHTLLYTQLCIHITYNIIYECTIQYHIYSITQISYI